MVLVNMMSTARTRITNAVTRAYEIDSRFELVLAYVAGATLFLPSPVTSKVSVGSWLCVLALPFIVRRAGHSRSFRLLCVLVAAFALTSVALTAIALSTGTGRTFAAPNAIAEVGALITLFTSIIVVYWFARVAGPVRAIIVVSASACLWVLVFLTPEQAENPWKYVLVWPVATLVIALTLRLPLWASLCGIATLAGVSLWAESRNAAGALVVAGLLALVLRWVPGGISFRRRAWILAGSAAALATLVFVALTQLIALGAFGPVLQERGVRQGAIWLLGSRVEPFAMWGYVQSAPLGMGLGIAPSAADRNAALSELQAAGIASTPYVEDRLLGPHVDLHSIVGSLWWDAGLVGIVLALYLFVLLARCTVAARQYIPLIAYFFVQASWDLVFSPLIANGRWVGVAIGFVLAAQHIHARAAARKSPEEVASPPAGSQEL